MPDKAWKAAERSLSRILDGIRIPNSGYGQPDVVAGNLALQLKYRKSLPQWLLDAMDQAIIDANATQQPLLVLHHAQRGHKARRLLIVDMDHWKDLSDD